MAKKKPKLRRPEVAKDLCFQSWDDDRVFATYRVAKTRLHPFFSNPYLMIELRAEVEKRKPRHLV